MNETINSVTTNMVLDTTTEVLQSNAGSTLLEIGDIKQRGRIKININLKVSVKAINSAVLKIVQSNDAMTKLATQFQEQIINKIKNDNEMKGELEAINKIKQLEKDAGGLESLVRNIMDTANNIMKSLTGTSTKEDVKTRIKNEMNLKFKNDTLNQNDIIKKVQNTIENKVVNSNSKCGGSTSNSSATTNAYNTQSELSDLKSKVSFLNSQVAEKDGTIAKLNREVAALSSEKYQLEASKTNLTNSVNSLQQQYTQKDAQYNKLKEEFNELSDRRTSVRKSKYNADEFHALTFKIGLHTFYPSINPISLGKFDASLLSYGAETMLGFNFGDSYRRNSIGITLRANQTNRFLTQAFDSSASNPIQYYDAELTTLIREWLSIGVGATVISAYGATSYQITPSASLGLCLGPKNWKIQLTQQAGLNSDKKIIGRASLGIALRL